MEIKNYAEAVAEVISERTDLEVTVKEVEKMMNEIKGYKYYLERCEEREITENLSDKKMLRKVIPYAIVLKLNRKILDTLF